MPKSFRTTAMIACAIFAITAATPSRASEITPLLLGATSLQAALEPIETVSAPPLSLSELINSRTDREAPDADQECIAAAVYFEARGEPIEGQLAVADVVLNRAASGKYPSSICAVVKQAAQFSFVRRGRIPRIARASDAWRKAVAIAHVAAERLVQQLGSDVLWYHASHVHPVWGNRLMRITRIGAHIFYSENAISLARL